MAKKKEPTLIERAWDSVKGFTYETKKTVSSVLDRKIEKGKTKEEEKWESLKERDKELERQYPGSSVGRMMNIETNDSIHSRRLSSWSRQKKINRNRGDQRKKVEKSIEQDDSSLAAYERLTNPDHTYTSVRDLLREKALIERFSPKGKSAFDIKINPSKVSSIENAEEIEALLQTAAASVETLTQEQIEIVLAFGDAKLLGRVTQVKVEMPESSATTEGENVVAENAETTETCLGDQLITRLGVLKKENIETAQNNAVNGEEMKSYIAKDKDLSFVTDMAATITDSAVEYFGNMMKAFQPIEQ